MPIVFGMVERGDHKAKIAPTRACSLAVFGIHGDDLNVETTWASALLGSEVHDQLSTMGRTGFVGEFQKFDVASFLDADARLEKVRFDRALNPLIVGRLLGVLDHTEISSWHDYQAYSIIKIVYTERVDLQFLIQESDKCPN